MLGRWKAADAWQHGRDTCELASCLRLMAQADTKDLASKMGMERAKFTRWQGCCWLTHSATQLCCWHAQPIFNETLLVTLT